MRITELKKEDYAGKRFTERYSTPGYYDVEKGQDTYTLSLKSFPETKERSFEVELYEAWLDSPVAYGVFEKDILLGVVEGFLEKWNNRYRISNIFIPEEENRRRGIGSMLMRKIKETAVQSGARMLVLETQSCNVKAIAFYKKHGLEIIGFDLYAYSNTDPERHEVRIEMGLPLSENCQ